MDLKWHMDWCSCQNCRPRSLSNLHQIDNQQAQEWLLESKKKTFKFSTWKPRIWARYSLIFSQRSSPFPVYPGMQVQDIVLNGSVLWTVQSALLAQGAIAKHGSLHFSCKHDCLLGQSLSVVHSTFGIGTVLEEKENKMNGWRNGQV